MASSLVYRLSDEDIRRLTAHDAGLSSEITDEMAIPTYTHRFPLIRWLMWRRYAYIAEMARLREDMAVLEFGCGIGVFLPTLSNRTERVYAIDLFPVYAQRLSEEQDLGVVFIDDLSELADHTLDIVVAADVLEHIEDPGAYFETFRKKLKQGGRLIISGPTENVIYKMGRFVAGFGDKGAYHLTDILKLKDAALKKGFVLRQHRSLPFKIPPFLFKIYAFENT